MRFIYQGQFLCDKNTIKSYNIKDQTTIHCHITSKQPRTDIVTDTTNSTRQIVQNSQTPSITRIASLSSPSLAPNNNNSATVDNPTQANDLSVNSNDTVDNGVVTSITSTSNQSNFKIIVKALRIAKKKRSINFERMISFD